MGLMNHLGTLGLERVLYMSKETASITLIEEIANYNELLVRTRNAWDASMRKAVKVLATLCSYLTLIFARVALS